MKIKLVQDIIDLLRGKKKSGFIKKLKLKINLYKIKHKKVIKIAFLHMYATDCQDINIFEKMLTDNRFDPYFIINPDIMRSKENYDFNYKRTKDELIKKYGAERVLDGYDYSTDKFIDYTKQFDIMSTNNPYDNMTNKFFQIKYWAKKGKPVIYCNYSYMGRTNYEKNIYSLAEFKHIWRIYTENNDSKQDMIACGVNDKNILVSGYSKMDNLYYINRRNNDRKKIIIAPHHTIFPGALNLGSFLLYSDCILSLPSLYPDIDFVFRPHPLLVENLKKCWGKTKTNEYLEKMMSFSNVEYQLSGEYLDTFVNSDALIHDCGSFLSEYMYTNHPQCHMFKDKNIINDEFTGFGQEILKNVYKAFNERDILQFIDDVVIKGNDTMKDARTKFAKERIMINYPHATDFIIKDLKNALNL